MPNCKVWCKTKNPLPCSNWAILGLLTDGRGQKGRPISKISHTSYNDETRHSYALPKKYPKNTRIAWTTSWVLLTSAFFTRNQSLLLYQETKTNIALSYTISVSFHNFVSLRFLLIDEISTLMISAKLATLSLLKIQVFWSKGYGVIISVHDITKNYHVTQIILQMLPWFSFNNLSLTISMVLKWTYD